MRYRNFSIHTNPHSVPTVSFHGMTFD